MFMEWQSNKTAAAEQAWRDKVAEIKLRYPVAEQAWRDKVAEIKARYPVAIK